MRTIVFDNVQVLVLGSAVQRLRMLRFQLAQVLIVFILGPIIEPNFKHAMLFSYDEFPTFFERSVSGVTLTLLMPGRATFKMHLKKYPAVAARPD